MMMGGLVTDDHGAGQGDNDPVDVVEIGSKTLATGGVYPVKPLAILAMIGTPCAKAPLPFDCTLHPVSLEIFLFSQTLPQRGISSWERAESTRLRMLGVPLT